MFSLQRVPIRAVIVCKCTLSAVLTSRPLSIFSSTVSRREKLPPLLKMEDINVRQGTRLRVSTLDFVA